jgi:hypothetical protein
MIGNGQVGVARFVIYDREVRHNSVTTARSAANPCPHR